MPDVLHYEEQQAIEILTKIKGELEGWYINMLNILWRVTPVKLIIMIA